MPDAYERGDHGYVDAHHKDQIHEDANLAKSVFDAEIEAIDRRRKNIKTRNRAGCDDRTGLALSGGGVRSASFGLGALQALHVFSGIEGIDYLSTVSGGGYIGCSLTAAMQKSAVGQSTSGIEKTAATPTTNGEFPFTNPENYDDTDSVRHIRDFSNFLIPHGALDVVTALGIIGRGLIANVLIILPVLLFFVWFTLLIYPTVDWLGKPRFLFWDCRGLIDRLGLQNLPGYWFTVILTGVNIVFLVFWAFAKSVSTSHFWQTRFARLRKPGDSAELRGGLATFSKILFFVTVTLAWFETQPFILKAMVAVEPAPGSGAGLPGQCTSWLSGACFGAVLRNWFMVLTPWFAAAGTVFAYVSKYLGDIVALAKRDTAWQAWLKKILAMAALWLAAIFIPSLLWLLYLQLTYFGISHPEFRYLPDWLSSFAYATPQAISTLPHFLQCLVPTVAALVYFAAFFITLLVARVINPNVTSLYRLYRDRLSKAFLFDPDGRRDKHGDLPAYEPKLHQIDTNLCPYPIVNASLNIEGSQYANKRGRDADFFAFTPEYTGSDATGYIGTRRIEEDETALDLGTAMAISAAAVSSNMGALTIKPLTFTLALLNVRLGYWLRNPRRIVGHRPWYSRLVDFRSFLLFKEAFSWITEKSPTVLLTDGGHVENLGIYSLLKRRCKV
ncbi:MAG: patatin-like phospholipase family protein, partial [Candidatus Binatia bacterium]